MIYNPWKNYKLRFPFNGSEIIDNSYSQSWQDIFVITLLKGQQNGTYLEIGANAPQLANNTFLLSSKFNWNGVSIDCLDLREEWKTTRPINQFIYTDAISIDYTALLANSYTSNVIDYCQLDIDTGENILNILKKLPTNYKFKIITLETDEYTGRYTNVIKETREFLSNAGYQLLIKDVKVLWNGRWESYEDWWIHPDYVDLTLAAKIKNVAEKTNSMADQFLFEQLI